MFIFLWLQIRSTMLMLCSNLLNRVSSWFVWCDLWVRLGRLGSFQASGELQVGDAPDWISLKLFGLALPKHMHVYAPTMASLWRTAVFAEGERKRERAPSGFCVHYGSLPSKGLNVGNKCTQLSKLVGVKIYEIQHIKAHSIYWHIYSVYV